MYGSGPTAPASPPIKIGTPAAPTVVTATACNAGATVVWSEPAANGTAAVNGYVITVLTGATVVRTVTYPSTELSEIVGGLVNGTAYTFKVASRNPTGIGPASVASAAVKAGTPLAPTGVTVTPGNAKVTLAWTAPASNGTVALNGYVVTVLNGATVVRTLTYTATPLTRTVGTLTNGTSYTFRVASKNTVGIGTASLASEPVVPLAASG